MRTRLTRQRRLVGAGISAAVLLAGVGVVATVSLTDADPSSAAGRGTAAAGGAAAGKAAGGSVPSSATATLDTSYPIPGGAVFVSPSGSDRNRGSKNAPLRTLAAALHKAPAGGTVVMRGGVYREGSSDSVYKKLTLQAYPHEQVWLDGTDVVSTGWASAGAGVWARSWSTPSFCAGRYYERPYGAQKSDNSGPCTHRDMARDPANPAAGDPQMVFANDRHLREVTTRGAVRAGTFFYDQRARKIYVGADPRTTRLELAARPTALVLQGGNGFTIRGIGFRRYATNEFPGNTTHGAVLGGHPNVVIERSVFLENAGAGLSYSNSRGGVVRSSYFAHNGFNGLDANGHWSRSRSTPDNFVLENSYFDGNNRELFGTGCDASCAAAGSKMAHMNGFTIRGNVFANGQGKAHGFWCDLACNRGVMVNNVFRHNGGTGLYYEVSDTGIIASNLMVGNKSYGLKVGSARTRIYNNTIVGNRHGVLLYDDDRSHGVKGWKDVGPDTRDVDLVNNVFSGNGGPVVSAWRTSGHGRNSGPDRFVRTLDSNSYFRPGGNPATLVEWRDGRTQTFASVSALRAAKGKETRGQDVTARDKPLVAEGPRWSYRVTSAVAPGAHLPGDIAAAIGVRAGGVSRGALVMPGGLGGGSGRPTAPTPSTSPSGAGAPVVRSQPGNGAAVRGLVHLTAAASGARVTGAELFLGSDRSATFSGPGPYVFGFDSTRVRNGTVVRVTWRVRTAAGAVATESRLTVRN